MRAKDMELEKLLEWLKKYDLSELTFKEGRFQITLKKEGQRPPFATYAVPAQDDSLPSVVALKEIEPSDHAHEVRAPLVGTFYRSPTPDLPPFVEEGDLVDKNDKLCIVEAMKIMNEIESPVRGIVKEICVKNGISVEFGQVLFRIETQEGME